jgi:methionyl-tRNA formyltransferase
VLCEEALDEGIARALAGEPGLSQDEPLASYGVPFTPEERRLRWHRPVRLLAKQVAALESDTLARHESESIAILNLQPEPVDMPDARPGTVLERDDREAVVRAQDGVVRVTNVPYDTGATSG